VTPPQVRSFASHEFPVAGLVERKGDQRVSVCIPARNEALTVGAIVRQTRINLTDAEGGPPLVDEILVMDDRSTDATAAEATAAGARVVAVPDVLPDEGELHGKGNVLWKSVAASEGDIVVWVDADLTSFGPACVSGLIGPLLHDDAIVMVKGFYERPEIDGTGGGRTTELMARPLLATLFPHLTSVHQPLGGEYSARREILERVPFAQGYGVETGLLIDIADLVGVDRIAQVDLGTRIHRNRPLGELSEQAMEVLHAALHRAGIPWKDDWSNVLRRPHADPVMALVDERPPLIDVAGYRR
jgi:glucosyl-3-phosphoglycerate synthase